MVMGIHSVQGLGFGAFKKAGSDLGLLRFGGKRFEYTTNSN